MKTLKALIKLAFVCDTTPEEELDDLSGYPLVIFIILSVGAAAVLFDLYILPLIAH